jgi:protein-tyrosine phosphatase
MQQPIRILMVCMGNICRSPTAEAVLRHRIDEAGLAGFVEVDSAGTHAFHVGNPPDERSQLHARLRGYELGGLRARRVSDADYQSFDLLLAMDWDNLSLLEQGAPDDAAVRRKLRRLVDFIPTDDALAGTQVVPDPYGGGPDGFENVLDLIEAACDGLIEHLRMRVHARQPGSADH